MKQYFYTCANTLKTYRFDTMKIRCVKPFFFAIFNRFRTKFGVWGLNGKSITFQFKIGTKINIMNPTAK